MKYIKLFENWASDETTRTLDLSRFVIDTSGEGESIFVMDMEGPYYIYLGDKQTCKELERMASPHFFTEDWHQPGISFVGISGDRTTWIAGDKLDDPADDNYNLVVMGQNGSESFNDEASEEAYLFPLRRELVIKVDQEHGSSEMTVDQLADLIQDFDKTHREEMKDFLDRNPKIPRGSY